MENIVFNKAWGLDIAIEMTLLNIASFTAILAYFNYVQGRAREAALGGVVATILPIVSMAILISHILKPEAFYLIFLSPQPRSWMLYGALGITLLVIFSLLFTISLLGRPSGFRLISALGRSRIFMSTLGILLIITGVFVSLYTGLVLAYERGIPFWHTGAVPIIALVMGVVGGLSAYSIIAPRNDRVAIYLGASTLVLLVFYIIHIHLSLIGPIASRASALVVLGSPVFTASLVMALVVGVMGIAAVWLRYARVKYVHVALGVMGIITIFLMRTALMTAAAWELPII